MSRLKIAGKPPEVKQWTVEGLKRLPLPMLDEKGREVKVVLTVYKDHPQFTHKRYAVQGYVLPVDGRDPIPLEPIMGFESMQMVRDAIAKMVPHYVCVPRAVHDDVPIVETWEPPPRLVWSSGEGVTGG